MDAKRRRKISGDVEEVGREIRRPEINVQKSINNAYKKQWERRREMKQAGRLVANLISEINGAARHAEAKCSDIYALKYFPLLKRLYYAFYIICEHPFKSRVLSG